MGTTDEENGSIGLTNEEHLELLGLILNSKHPFNSMSCEIKAIDCSDKQPMGLAYDCASLDNWSLDNIREGHLTNVSLHSMKYPLKPELVCFNNLPGASFNNFLERVLPSWLDNDYLMVRSTLTGQNNITAVLTANFEEGPKGNLETMLPKGLVLYNHQKITEYCQKYDIRVIQEMAPKL